jgi:hypothetical protein
MNFGGYTQTTCKGSANKYIKQIIFCILFIISSGQLYEIVFWRVEGIWFVLCLQNNLKFWSSDLETNPFGMTILGALLFFNWVIMMH